MYRPSPTYTDVTFRKSWRKSQLRVNVVNYVVCIGKAVLFCSDSSTREPDIPQHDRPADCVIAQQYSSSTLVSQRFLCRKEKFGACQKCYGLIFKLEVYICLRLDTTAVHNST